MDTTLGRLVVERGLASADEVQACVELQRRHAAAAKESSLGAVLLEQGVVTRAQLERLRPSLDNRPNQQIPGYQILKKLGAGAMATVYKARQVSLDRMVAIKVLPQKYSNNADFIERFYAEGRAAGRLNHPNIVQAYDVGKAGEFHYFVMEYVEGRTVFDDITQRGVYDEADAVRIAIEVSNALKHAHDRGFIHRDVKPKNIMIEDAHGRVKLADMGLARAISDREAAEAEAGKAYGTPYYISPEQIRGEVDVDFRADIYSLGATVYHMVTGQVPFDGPNPSAVMHRHLKDELTPADHINPKLDSGLAEVIEVCMAKDRNKRYNSTADLLEDLQAIERGEPPMQARKVFDINALSALEGKPGGADAAAAVSVRDQAQDATLYLWLAVSGWAAAGVLLILFLVVALTG